MMDRPDRMDPLSSMLTSACYLVHDDNISLLDLIQYNRWYYREMIYRLVHYNQNYQPSMITKSKNIQSLETNEHSVFTESIQKLFSVTQNRALSWWRHLSPDAVNMSKNNFLMS